MTLIEERDKAHRAFLKAERRIQNAYSATPEDVEAYRQARRRLLETDEKVSRIVEAL